MRIIVLSLILFCCGTCPITAQSDYIVTTPSTQEIPVGEEEQFIKNNFPLQPLCKWTPGMKFMFVPSTRNMFLPTLSSYDTDKGIIIVIFCTSSSFTSGRSSIEVILISSSSCRHCLAWQRALIYRKVPSLRYP